MNGVLIWSFKSCKSSMLKHVAPIISATKLQQLMAVIRQFYV
jgi:hypothetical protein